MPDTQTFAYAPEDTGVVTVLNDIIKDLNHGTQGYVEWCMILSHKGQPNPYDNFNSSPVLINPESDEVIYTPLYYLLTHFSRFIRPGAHRIGLTGEEVSGLQYTAAENPDGSLAVVIFNRGNTPRSIELHLKDQVFLQELPARSLQTIQIQN